MGNPVNEDQSMARLGLCSFWDNPGGDYVTYMSQIRVNSITLCIIAPHRCLCVIYSGMLTSHDKEDVNYKWNPEPNFVVDFKRTQK